MINQRIAVHEQVTRRFRDVQVLLEEFVDGLQLFFREAQLPVCSEILLQKSLSVFPADAVDQTPDAERAVAGFQAFLIKGSQDLQCHSRLCIGILQCGCLTDIAIAYIYFFHQLIDIFTLST